jgi:hypothetical protein
MQPRIFLAAVFVLTGSLGFAACGGDDDDDGGSEDQATELEEYFVSVEQIKAAYDTDVRALDQDLEAIEALPAEEQLDALRGYYRDSETRFGTAIEELDALDPPSEAEEPHDAFVGAGDEVLELSASLYAELEEVETVEAANELFESTPEIDEASANFENACRDLQSLADENAVDANLGCGEA